MVTPSVPAWKLFYLVVFNHERTFLRGFFSMSGASLRSPSPIRSGSSVSSMIESVRATLIHPAKVVVVTVNILVFPEASS